MLRPRTHADPAELIAAATCALLACHVIAALVLLDVLVAGRALLRIRLQPGHVIGLSSVFLFPLVRYFAIGRFVRWLSAFEARDRTTEVADDVVEHLRLVEALASDTAFSI